MPSNDSSTLRVEAAKARRLARGQTDPRTIEMLNKYAAECDDRADALDVGESEPAARAAGGD